MSHSETNEGHRQGQETPLSGPGVLSAKPGQTLLWLGIFAALATWGQATFFPDDAAAVEDNLPANDGVSSSVLAALDHAETDGIVDENAKNARSLPIASKDNPNQQGLVNLFHRIYHAISDDDSSRDSAVKTPAEKTPTPGDGEPVEVTSEAFQGESPDAKSKPTADTKKEETTAHSIEDPHNAMTAFYEALKNTQDKKEGAITRVVQFGDSTIVADKITGTVRRKLQERFGDSGHGWLLVGKPWDYYIHDNVWFDAHKGWRMNRLTSNPIEDKRHGLGGVTSRGVGTGLWADFQTSSKGNTGKSISRFEIYYTTHKRGGKVAIDVDGKEQLVFDTKSGTIEDKVQTVTMPDGHHRVRLRVASAGEVRLYGVTLGRDVPGVTYDSLGVTGIRAKTFVQRTDEAHFQGQLKLRNPNLFVVMLGTNESEFESMDLKEYEEEYELIIKRIRQALPDSSCLIASPPDRAKKSRSGRMTTAKLIPKMVDIQRAVASRNECAFFNTFEAMGGKGSMAAWYRNKPRLASGDFTHFTAAGGEILGTIFYDAIMGGYEKVR